MVHEKAMGSVTNDPEKTKNLCIDSFVMSSEDSSDLLGPPGAIFKHNP